MTNDPWAACIVDQIAAQRLDDIRQIVYRGH